MHIHRCTYIDTNTDTQMHIQTRTHIHTICIQIYIDTLCTHIYTYNGMDYWCTSVMGAQYIDTHLLHYRTLRTHNFLSKNAPTDPHPYQTKIHVALFAPSKKTPSHFHTNYHLHWLRITPTYWVINFWFRGFFRLFSITCGAAFLKYFPFVILMNLPTVIQPNFIFLTIDAYMISYRAPKRYIYTKFSPAFGLSKEGKFMNGYYLPII